MAERPFIIGKGEAFLLVNSYTTPPFILPPLIRIDEACKDFWDTFNVLGFRTVIWWNLTEEKLFELLQMWMERNVTHATKHVVFYFIGHGGDGDILYMEDGGEVTTNDILTTFGQLRGKICKFFFMDACRRTGAYGPPSAPAFCPGLANSLLARSTLPYHLAHTGDSYGKLSGIHWTALYIVIF